MAYTLPKLKFGYSALKPWMDAKTVEIHYSKHHQTYCDKLNEAMSKYSELSKKKVEQLLSDLKSIPAEIKTAVVNFGGGYVNHNFFWDILSPKRQACKGEIAKAIDKEFGSFDEFKKRFSESAAKLFGSGWTWLVFDKMSRKLEIVNTSNQNSPLSEGKIPLLVIDVWEHAYYLKYQNRRGEFIENFFNIIDWKRVDEIYNSCF